jgi:hypothetical protein
MLDTFALVGAQSFDLTQTDIQGRKRSFRPHQKWEPLRRGMAWLLESAIARQDNLIVRPRGTAAELVQLDDLSAAGLERVGEVAFLILATSAGNHQAWVAVSDGCAQLARRLRQGCDADAGASGATRIAGSLNFKPEYAPEFPTVSILESRPQRITSRAEVERLGWLAPDQAQHPTPPPRRVSPSGRPRPWPSYDRCLRDAPLARSRDAPDVSRADFTFCLLAIDWGWSVSETCQRLLQLSSKARLSKEAYAKLTAARAAAAIARRNPKPVSGIIQKSSSTIL